MKLPKLIPFLLIILAGCQQEIDPNIISDPGTGNGNGSTGNYQPLTAGSWWKYKDSTSGVFTTLKATTVTKTMNNISYTAVEATGQSGIDTVYQAAPAPDYYYTAKGASPNTGAPFDVTFHYLNDTASIGYNWQYDAGHGNGFTAICKTTIIEKGISLTIQGKTYNDVIHTKLELSYDIFGMITPAASYDYYLSKGVGIVKVRADIGAFGVGVQTCSDLVEHHME